MFRQILRVKWVIPLLLVFLAVVVVIFINGRPTSSSNDSSNKGTVFSDLKTDTSNSSIDTSKVLSGGPGKDGIPSIDNPKFVTIKDSDWADSSLGIVLSNETTARFYPYGILTWHEIVNDIWQGDPVAITFCPLCGSAIVFNRTVYNNVLEFGVSGLLFESNLLMYDRATESLWSQARGEAVIGGHVGTKLELVNMQVLEFSLYKEKYPNGLVLSDETGYTRNYKRNPYSGYNDNENLFFPVSVDDNRFKSKRLMFVFPFKEKSVSLPADKLTSINEVSVEGEILNIVEDGGEVTITDSNNNTYPGYYEMWFSWATHHQEDGIVLELNQ